MSPVMLKGGPLLGCGDESGDDHGYRIHFGSAFIKIGAEVFDCHDCNLAARSTAYIDYEMAARASSRLPASEFTKRNPTARRASAGLIQSPAQRNCSSRRQPGGTAAAHQDEHV